MCKIDHKINLIFRVEHFPRLLCLGLFIILAGICICVEENIPIKHGHQTRLTAMRIHVHYMDLELEVTSRQRLADALTSVISRISFIFKGIRLCVIFIQCFTLNLIVCLFDVFVLLEHLKLVYRCHHNQWRAFNISIYDWLLQPLSGKSGLTVYPLSTTY